MNAEITKLCGQIKERLEELQMTEFVVYASDYWGDLDEDVVEEKVNDTATSLDFYFNSIDGYSGYSRTSEFIRKVKVKDGNVVFDVESVYEDDNVGWESKGYYEDQTMDDVLQTCPEETVLTGLNAVLKYALTENEYYDIVGLNQLNQ